MLEEMLVSFMTAKVMLPWQMEAFRDGPVRVYRTLWWASRTGWRCRDWLSCPGFRTRSAARRISELRQVVGAPRGEAVT